MNKIAQDFIEFAIQSKVLRFGEFKTKAGRLSPYFFNAGLFYDGALLGRLAEFYAAALKHAMDNGQACDMLFGPAYKGITLASATAVAAARNGNNVPFVYNRKEAKDHGEGGVLVGAPLKGKVVIIDDVISAGTSVRESVEMIRAAGAQPAGVIISIDRQEKSGDAVNVGERSATQEVTRLYGIPVIAIATLADLMRYLDRSADAALGEFKPKVAAYKERYGV